ncbi:MAG TPA: hypothetical protein PLO78_03035 [Candidatus Omnitrophota bacterium]|nr:hypothetical protein [Candidatus Omnitrophota bacterium]
MKKVITLIILIFFVLGSATLFAGTSEKNIDGKKTNGFQQILNVQERGIVSGLSSPWEFVRTFKTEKQLHPKAWPATYLPRSFLNFTTRAVSGVNDVAVLPWYVNVSGDPKPITSRFDLPDYPWQKE